ncbi:MAG TPA: abortive infection system antitoxin AbiGi family protein [Bacteroidia bacterium]|nr:abortive infection system antitoxin AbiGi family protein [Bacteroidia bacterium]
MGLSSNSIIHFTNTKEKLKGILTENFKIKYCLEEILFTDGGPVKYAAPMVSFCDIPFSEVKNHISNYGPYGIGLTKEWAERNGLNPVIYLDRKSSLAKSYWSIYDNYLLKSKKKMEELNPEENSLLDLLRYMKNYQSDLVRAGKVSKDYRFSDEREWRYVPPFSKDYFMVLAESYYDTDEKKLSEN